MYFLFLLFKIYFSQFALSPLHLSRICWESISGPTTRLKSAPTRPSLPRLASGLLTSEKRPMACRTQTTSSRSTWTCTREAPSTRTCGPMDNPIMTVSPCNDVILSKVLGHYAQGHWTLRPIIWRLVVCIVIRRSIRFGRFFLGRNVRTPVNNDSGLETQLPYSILLIWIKLKRKLKTFGSNFCIQIMKPTIFKDLVVKQSTNVFSQGSC